MATTYTDTWHPSRAGAKLTRDRRDLASVDLGRVWLSQIDRLWHAEAADSDLGTARSQRAARTMVVAALRGVVR